jgi:hypothetical protein
MSVAQKFRLIFMDGTTEKVDAIGLTVAFIKGIIRAAEKKTYLLKVEEA